MPGNLDENLEALAPQLHNLHARPVLNWIDGEERVSQGDRVFTNSTPVDSSHICNVALSSERDVDIAATSSEIAFDTWKHVAGTKRKQILHRIADLIVERAEEIALCESWDTGQPIRYMAKAALRGAANFRYFADQAPAARDGQSLPSPTLLNLTTRVPIGPVAIITPWNTPFMLSTWKIAPALAAGCTVVHKPAESSPVSARILAEISREAGLPNGVWNVINGEGEEAGAALVRHPKIRAVAFVGESRTGSEIMRNGAATLKRVHFELGGKNPVIVFDDADIERAVDAAVFMIYSLNGERCTSSSRVLVQDSIEEEFTRRLADRARKVRVGHPLDPETELGPLIDDGHTRKVTSYFAIAAEEGARIVAGGQPVDLDSNFVHPTLFADVKPDMRVAQEEIFGPVLSVLRFGSEDEAVRIANDIPYGLAGYVWTSDLTRGLRVANALDAGMIWINSENVRHLPTPFGGMKASGIGRDGGDWSFEFYMEQKHIGLATGRHTIPKLGS